MLEKSSKMSTRDAIAVLAGPYQGNRDRWLANASKSVAGVSFRTMRSLWHNEITNPDHLAAQAVIRQAKIIEAQRDAAKLGDIYRKAARAMGDLNPDLYRHQIDVLVSAARILGALDSAGTQGEMKD